MILFRIVYSIAIFAVFIIFRQSMDISLYMTFLYSVVAVLCVLLLDLLLGGIKSYRIISSLLIGIAFLVLGFLLIQSFQSVFQQKEINLIVLFLFLYAGIIIGNKNHKFFESLITNVTLKHNSTKIKLGSQPKVIDTSTLIDGRIANIVDCGFIEGNIVIPGFVLKELQNIADSHDHLRRQKGRRGLNVLKRLQEQTNIKVEIDNTSFDEIGTVDEKLLALSMKIHAAIITTDFNLMKVAEIQNIKVLNLNNLAIALRQTILPGEELVITIAKEGKDPSQGVGYLDDGTMVVVENGKKRIGETLKVEATSLLQTESGRIIFTKVKA